MQALKEGSRSLPLLADQFGGLLRNFNHAVVDEAITALEWSTERDSTRLTNGDLEKVIQKLMTSFANGQEIWGMRVSR